MTWPTVPGSGGLTIDGTFEVASNHNVVVNANAGTNSGQGVIALGNAITNPVSLGGATGGVLYVTGGELKFMRSDGTVADIT